MTSTKLRDTFTRRLFPTGYCKELKGLFKLSWPIIITMIFQFSLQPLAVIFCGRLGKTELDAVALANSLINVTGISVANGLATACDTLYSQTYGSKNKYKLGICLQRALLVIVLGIFPCWAIHLNTESILLLFGQDAQVSRLTARYLLIFMPGLLGFFLYVPLAKYIQNQNIVLPTMVIALVPNMVTVVMHYFMVTVCGMGTDGSAVAQAVSYLTFLPLVLGYIYFSKLYKNTWNGWSWECLEHWGLFFRLSIAGLFHISIEWWSFEIGTFLTGVLGTTELGAQSLLMNIETIIFMFPVGIGVSASIRVGQYLGSGSGDSAKTAYRTALTITWMVTLTIAILLMSLANYLPLIFTDVREVVDLASRLLPILGIYMVFDGTCGLSTGVLRGSGRQHVGVAVVVIGYLVLGLPIGIPLMFLTPLGISGWWWALAGALLIDSIIYTVILYFTNWERQAELAQKRVTINCASRQDQEETTALLGEQQKDNVNNCKDVIPKRPSVPIPPRKVSTLLPDSQFNMEHNLLEVSTKSRTQLLLQRLAVFILMICVLIFGILCRVFVPTQNKGLVEAFDCNDTSIIGTRT